MSHKNTKQKRNTVLRVQFNIRTLLKLMIFTSWCGLVKYYFDFAAMIGALTGLASSIAVARCSFPKSILLCGFVAIFASTVGSLVVNEVFLGGGVWNQPQFVLIGISSGLMGFFGVKLPSKYQKENGN